MTIQTQNGTGDDDRTNRRKIAEILKHAYETAVKSGPKYLVECELEGISPLLQDRMTEEQEVELGGYAVRKVGVKPELHFLKSAYLDANGLICQPPRSIKSAMIKAAGSFKIPKAKGKSYRDAFKAVVFIMPDLIPYQDQQVEKYTFSVPNKMNNRVSKSVPKIETGWKLRFYITIMDEAVNPSVVKDVLEHAGKWVGLGYGRPETGRFTITSWQLMNCKKE